MAAIRKSIYIHDKIFDLLRLPQRDDGGLSNRIGSIVESFEALYQSLIPSLKYQEWEELLEAIDVHEGDNEAVVEKCSFILSDAQWVVVYEAHYRYRIARDRGSKDPVRDAAGTAAV